MAQASPDDSFYAGAAAVNIDPPELPVIVNGGFLERTADKVNQSLFARSLVLGNGGERIALCVVDTCMVDRELCDEAKVIAARETGIQEDRILISATHTHSAPATMRALGCPADPKYSDYLAPKIAESIAEATGNVRPAQAAWAVVDAGAYTNTRRWIYLPHAMGTDPFGNASVRAMMHPGHQNPGTAGPAGPIDPDLTVLSLRDIDGRPLAMLGNLSMHYYGAAELSSDYTGKVCLLLEEAVGEPGFVAIMSQGTSGDLHFMDYSRSAEDQPYQGKPDGFSRYCEELTALVLGAAGEAEYRGDMPLAMAERKLVLERRLPDAERLAWADAIVAEMAGPPRNQPEVYAAEAHWIRDHPEAELKLQAVRVGDLGIAAIPCEVFGITGLKLKLQSPMRPTMNIELANGGAGYIPPPEQHELGGYTTWPARTAGLETEAEPKIVEAMLELLEQVSGAACRTPGVTQGAYAQDVLARRPIAYWSMDNHSGDQVRDVSTHDRHGRLEPGYALFLPGPDGAAFTSTERDNRAVHFAGGRMMAEVPELGDGYTVSLWFWNAMPHEVRAVTGYLFSRGVDGSAEGDHLGIDGAPPRRGKLVLCNGDTAPDVVAGTTELAMKRWYHIAMVRDGTGVRVYLDGEPEAEGTAAVTRAEQDLVFIGGRSDGLFGFEGKLDEVALFDRTLSAEEIADMYAASTREE